MHDLSEKEYRPKYPDSPFIHIADLVNLATGKTYREENAEMTHAIGIGALVEIKESGVRMFVVKLGRDCDMTPLYWLSPYAPDELTGTERNETYGGYGDESLLLIRAAQR